MRNEPTAAETYAKRASDIALLIEMLQTELEKHATDAKADPGNWGFAGDLGLIRHRLIDMVTTTSGAQDRVEIERFLGIE